MPTKHDDCSTEPGNFLIARSDSTGSWVVTCKTCATRWMRGQEDVPAHVREAVAVSVGMTALTEDEAREKARQTGGHVLRVGDRIFSTPKEPTIDWILAPEGVTARLIAPGVTKDEEAAFHRERTEFALTSGDHALCLSLRIGRAFDWGDGFWQAVKQKPHFEPGLPETGDEGHLAVHLQLIDGQTGILIGMRLVTWPPRFVKAVRKAVDTQIAHQGAADAGDREISTWLARYPTPRDLATRRAEIDCRGGAGR